MALNFNANQYEIAFRPTKLCNWEAVKKPSILPKGRAGATKIIANDRGHLLPGIRKLNPWTDTCVPTQPTLRTTNRSNHSSSDKMGHSDDILTSWEKRSSHVPFVPYELPAMKALPAPTSNSRRSSIDKENKSKAPFEEINTANGSQRSQPTCYTPARQNSVDQKCRSPSLLSRRASQISDPILASAYSNELVARNLKLHNQKHQTLADAVDVSARAASSKSHWLDVGDKIDTWVPAVGRKLFQSPGPTQCSKLKIFRPKTTEVTPAVEREPTPCDQRPNTAPRHKRLSEMDLAIYWDVSNAPSLPDETLKIDNVTLPPAVAETKNDDLIAMVDDYRAENSDERREKPNRSPSVATVVDDDQAGEETCPPLERKHSSTSILSGGARKKQIIRKSISNLPEATTSDRAGPARSLNARCTKLYASAPNLVNVGVQVSPINLRATARMCEACNVKPSHLKLPTAEPYKLAFKAGKPNTLTIDDQTLERLYKARHLSVPKPKMPYAKKSYSIGTLVPPFSVWPRAAGQDYPDHWRLASVYQHSYKPLETRKVPLMKTIFQ